MNSLNKDIPEGSIVEMWDTNQEFVCILGFGMKANLAGSVIFAYPKGKRRWIKIQEYRTTYDDEGRLASRKLGFIKVLKTDSISGRDIKCLVRKGWGKR